MSNITACLFLDIYAKAKKKNLQYKANKVIS